MTSMAFCNPNDMDFLDSVSMECDLQHEMEKILQNSDFLNNENSNQGSSHFDFDTNGQSSIDEWIQNIQWNDVAKIQQNLLDNSFEIENNNPNLLVNPQTVMPVTMAPAYQSSPKKSQFAQQSTLKTETSDGCTDANGSQQPGTNYGAPQSPQLKIESVVSMSPQTSSSQTLNQQHGFEQNNNRIQIQSVRSISAAAHNSPVLVEHLQNGLQNRQYYNAQKSPVTVSISNIQSTKSSTYQSPDKVFPKPVYSYSCLIAMALKNSRNGSLPVSEIYSFMTEHFPYFKTAPDGWKNSVRHNLSLNKCFEKVDTPKVNGNAKKGCLWALNPAKIEKMEEEIAKHRKKDLESILISMSKPEKLELIEAGKAGPVGNSEEEPLSPKPQTPSHVTSSKKLNIVTPTSGKSEYLIGDINLLDSNLSLDHPLPELSLQNGIWDELPSEIRTESLVSTPSTSATQIVTLSASPLTLPSTITLANGSIIQGSFTCTTSPMITQSSTVTHSNQLPSQVLTTRI